MKVVVVDKALEFSDLEVSGHPEPEDDASRHEDDKVDEEDDVLQHVAAAVAHCPLFLCNQR